MKKKPIDNKEVLNYFFDDRETFVVDYDFKLVDVELRTGEIVFSLRKEYELKEKKNKLKV